MLKAKERAEEEEEEGVMCPIKWCIEAKMKLLKAIKANEPSFRPHTGPHVEDRHHQLWTCTPVLEPMWAMEPLTPMVKVCF